jgi:hypothetical protein
MTNEPTTFVDYVRRQREWSAKTFGPATPENDRRLGVIDHIRKECVEAEADAEEFIDIVILAIDGLWRAGFNGHQIEAMLNAKYAKNSARVWPDWRTLPATSAIEHDRSFDGKPA